MNVAAYRRLQHRMEARGRTASSHASGHRCICVPNKQPTTTATTTAATTHASAAINTGPTSEGIAADSSGPSPSPTAHAWLLQHVQGVEVDITAGDTDHKRRVPCCCACCSGYHHLSHVPRSAEPTHDSPHPLACTAPVPTSSVEQSQREAQLSHNAPGDRSPSPVLGAMGRMLSAFIRRAEAVPVKQPAVSFAQTVIPSCTARAENVTTSPSGSLAHSILAGPTPTKRTHILSSMWRPLAETDLSVTNAVQTHPSVAPQTNSVMTMTEPPAPPEISKQQQEQQMSSPPPLAAPVTAAAAAVAASSQISTTPLTPPPEILRAGAIAIPIDPPTPPPLPPPPLPVPAVAAVAAAAAPTLVGHSQADTAATPAPICSSSINIPSPEPAQRPEASVNFPAGSNTAGVMPPVAQPVASGATVNTISRTDDPTAVEVMNALRERLLLENADAYVRGLERKQQQQEEEKQQQHSAWDCQRGDIVALLTRLQQDDHEMIEALYETVTSRESDGPTVLRVEVQDAIEDEVEPLPKQKDSIEKAVSTSSFPKEVMAAYSNGGVKANSLQRVSSAAVQTESQSHGNVILSQALNAVTNSPEVHMSLPLPPPLPPPNAHPSVPLLPIPKTQSRTQASVETQTQSPAPGVTTPSAGYRIMDATPYSDSMQAWVDNNFGTTLDPQHRALLQHVLLSREAEVRRAAAAEARCRNLDAKLSASSALAPQEASASVSVPQVPTVPVPQLNVAPFAPTSSRTPIHTSTPSQIPYPTNPQVGNRAAEERDGNNLPGAVSMIQMHDKEMAALRTMQREHDARLQELTQAYKNILSQQQQLSYQKDTDSSTVRGIEEELRRWKLRCEALEQQQNNTQRIADLQAYVGQLRSGAQQASMIATQQPADVTTVHLSAVDSLQPSCCLDTAAASPLNSTSTALPPQPQQPQQQQQQSSLDTALVQNGSAQTTVSVSAGNDGSRAAALQQLRSELDAECARFAEETQRWRSYVRSQEQAH